MENKIKYCKKIVYKLFEQDENPKILFGLLIKENEDFVFFKTGKRDYTISRKCILSLEDTTKVFREVV